MKQIESRKITKEDLLRVQPLVDAICDAFTRQKVTAEDGELAFCILLASSLGLRGVSPIEMAEFIAYVWSMAANEGDSESC